MSLRSIEQERAEFAWKAASANKGDKFSTIVSKTPAYIKTNGLLNTLAFLYSDANYKPLLSVIKDWLFQCKLVGNFTTDKDFMDFMVKKTEARFMIHCTNEVLEFFNWLRRFVD